ncbi:MAG: lysophospholipid acyltransferase family protein [Alphaproteobacteria bacterium]
MEFHRSYRLPLRKRLLKNGAVLALASFLLALWLRTVFLLSRVEYRWPEDIRAYAGGKAPALFCFWHGRLAMHPFVSPPKRPQYVLISGHADGRLISTVIRFFGIDTITGSRGKNVTGALKVIKRVAAEGGNIGITPDGPRGPFQKAAPGAAYVAAITGYPIVVTAFSASRHHRFKSWDKFMVPRPFGRIVFVAAAVAPPKDESDAAIGEATLRIERALTEVTAQADRLCGVAP